MKIILIVTIFSFLCIISLQNCGPESNHSCCTVKELIPLSEGNFWTYDNYYYTKPGKDTIYNADSTTLHIGKKIKLNNEDWYQWGFWGFDFANVCINKQEGLYNITNDMKDNFIIDSALLFFKYPTKIGDEWYSKFDEDTLMTVSLDKEIKVPAGKFRCIHFRRKSLSNYPNSGYYFAPGIGLIKYDNFIGHHFDEENPDTTWNILKLKRYKIK
jgi:hypothetical protein